MSVAIKDGIEIIVYIYGNGAPAVAGGPLGVDCAGGVAVGFIEVQRAGQLVAVAVRVADLSCLSVGKRGGVGFSVGVWIPVAIEVVADGVQLLQVGDLDEAVAVGVVLPVGRLGVGDPQSRRGQQGKED